MNFEVIESLNKILEDPQSEDTQAMLLQLGEGRSLSVDSGQFKELFLISAVNQFFPESSQDIAGYFDDSFRHKWSEKQLKITKTKRIRKFFGEKPSEEQLQRQNTSAVRHFGASTVDEESSMIKKNTPVLDFPVSDDEIESETSVRRKKQEKL